jgi:DNA-binding transcriptional LysR family regulator
MDTMTRFDLNGLATFVKVVECGSFSAAARQLGQTKSAISKQVTSLENSLRVRLLNRSTRQLSLTEVGQVVYQHGCRIADSALAIRMDAAGMQSKPSGLLRVSTSFAFGNMHLNAFLPEFMERYPDVQIALNLNDRYVDIVEEGYDLLIRLTDKLNHMSSVARPLADLRFVLVAAPKYLKTYGVPQALGDLAEHRCLTNSNSVTANTWSFQVDGKTVTCKINSVLAINSSESLRVAMLAGVGIALLPTFAVGQDIKDGTAVVLMRKYTPLSVFGTKIYAVYLQNRFLAPKVRVFIDFLVEKIGDRPYWDF